MWSQLQSSQLIMRTVSACNARRRYSLHDHGRPEPGPLVIMHKHTRRTACRPYSLHDHDRPEPGPLVIMHKYSRRTAVGRVIMLLLCRVDRVAVVPARAGLIPT